MYEYFTQSCVILPYYVYYFLGKQFYSFSSIESADVYCRVKYIYQYKGKNALLKANINPDDYETVYQDCKYMLILLV